MQLGKEMWLADTHTALLPPLHVPPPKKRAPKCRGPPSPVRTLSAMLRGRSRSGLGVSAGPISSLLDVARGCGISRNDLGPEEGRGLGAPAAPPDIVPGPDSDRRKEGAEAAPPRRGAAGPRPEPARRHRATRRRRRRRRRRSETSACPRSHRPPLYKAPSAPPAPPARRGPRAAPPARSLPRGPAEGAGPPPRGGSGAGPAPGRPGRAGRPVPAAARAGERCGRALPCCHRAAPAGSPGCGASGGVSGGHTPQKQASSSAFPGSARRLKTGYVSEGKLERRRLSVQDASCGRG